MTQTSPVLTRRRLVFGAAASLVLVGAGMWHYTHPQAAETAAALSVSQAHAAARAGEILLLDIRRPDEWARTGVGVGAIPLDMRRDDFLTVLSVLTAGDPSRPVAVMCARGVRSARLTQALADAGYTNLIDVPEGMLGSAAGPGWLATGLPVTVPE